MPISRGSRSPPVATAVPEYGISGGTEVEADAAALAAVFCGAAQGATNNEIRSSSVTLRRYMIDVLEMLFSSCGIPA
jgi:hypothetical protein